MISQVIPSERKTMINDIEKDDQGVCAFCGYTFESLIELNYRIFHSFSLLSLFRICNECNATFDMTHSKLLSLVQWGTTK